MATVFYLRVSTTDQSSENQLREINNAGFKADKVFRDDAISGNTAALEREGWRECFSYLREGDVLVVYAVDRLGRSTIDCLQTIQSIADRGVRLVIIKQGFDTSSASGKLALTMFAAFAEFESSIRRERQMAGISRVRAQGGLLGRPRALTDEDIKNVIKKLRAGTPKAQVARDMGINRSTLYRQLAELDED